MEELRLLAQCRAESNLKGSISAVLAGGLAYQAIKSFNLKVNPKWGPYPKVGSACLFGFFLGKLMAIPTCYEKFKSLPNSPLGAYMRQRRGDLGERYSISFSFVKWSSTSIRITELGPRITEDYFIFPILFPAYLWNRQEIRT